MSGKAMYAVIMAGGRGTRFWPRSTEKRPKHLLEVFGSKSLLRETFERIRPLVPVENIIVVTGQGHVRDVRRQLPEIPGENVLIEPEGRNTAPCIGLAAINLLRKDPTGTMIVLPADHYIADRESFLSAIDAAARTAEIGGLVAVGVKPRGPETGYGYVEKGEPSGLKKGVKVYRARSFREKPDLRKAKEFVRSNRFLWNSGIFAWKASVILDAIQSNLPELHRGLLEIKKALGSRGEKSVIRKVYRSIEPVSIDYGVMEKSRDVFLVEGSFGWSDVGSWDALLDLLPGDDNENVIIGNAVSIDAEKSYVYSPDRLVALLGVKDLIIVDTPDSLLICRRGMSQDVKKIVDHLEKKKMIKYF